MRSRKTKNDEAWAHLFHDFNILNRINSDGSFRISSAQINKYREARLMTKFDHESNLPELFTENNLSILPITRGDYLIGPMEIYKKIDDFDDDIINFVKLPGHLQSLKYNDITGESAAISCAYASGMLEHFLGEKLLPTVSGRMSSDSFKFTVQNTLNDSKLSIEVNNSQIEIDGGYEGCNSLCLIEAKNSISNDFLIRQLYYPYRLWKKKIKKTIRLIFMIFTNGIFNLYEYEFGKEEDINSINLVKTGRYSLERPKITTVQSQLILQSAQKIPEPEIPFPQADSFERVINLCELLYEKELTKDEITTTYDFNKRQTDYYTNAGKYLGLIEDFNKKETEQEDVGYRLTKKGKSILGLNFNDRQLKFVELIINHSAFAKVLSLYFDKSEEPSRVEVLEIMKKSNLYKVESDSTFNRRASTVISWVRWIIELSNSRKTYVILSSQPVSDNDNTSASHNLR